MTGKPATTDDAAGSTVSEPFTHTSVPTLLGSAAESAEPTESAVPGVVEPAVKQTAVEPPTGAVAEPPVTPGTETPSTIPVTEKTATAVAVADGSAVDPARSTAEGVTGEGAPTSPVTPG